jgi:hypothetical protein
MSLAIPDQRQSTTELPAGTDLASRQLANLERSFGCKFALWDGETGDLLVQAGHEPECDTVMLAEMVRAAVNHRDPVFLAEAQDVVILALPFSIACSSTLAERRFAAVAPFLTAEKSGRENLGEIAHLLSLAPGEAQSWLDRQSPWPAHTLLRTGKLALENLELAARGGRLETEIDKVSDNLAATYEEISLLYGVTQNLRLSSSDEELGQQVLDWLLECVPAEGMALQFLPVSDEGKSTYKARTKTSLLVTGDFPLDGDQLSELIEHLGLTAGAGPYVANTNVTEADAWRFPGIRQLIITPMAEGERVFGWLAAVNHEDGFEFGTVEASLLNSVSAILGIHSANHELYRQQSEFLASVVRALTSAIDAKDPYTCGHSDRVARVAVRLAKELEVDEGTMGTLYMAGLLHDIGKIGIDDGVLRKPGRLTDAEYEHIKLHPELGYRILADIRQLANVLPVVLHHHEQWDGRGYPHGLAGEKIPLLARIAAVADAYDAMSSDRPYRKGMPQEKVESIFRAGAGQQWDARVVDAFFAALGDIREISSRERANLSLDIQQWT